MGLLLSLLLSLLLLMPFVSSSCLFFCAYIFFSRSFCSSYFFHSSLGSSFCSPSFFFFGAFFSYSAVSFSGLLFRCSFLFACSASLVSAPPFPSAPVGPPRGFSATLSSTPFSSASLVSSMSSTPALSSRGPSGVLPYIFFVLLFSFFFSGCGEVLRYSRLRCSVSLRTFRCWIVGLWPTGVRLFAILLSFLVFVLTLLLVLLAFYLLCLSLLRYLLPPLWLLLSLRSLPYLAPVAPVTFFSSLAPSAALHGFIAHSLTFLSSAGSSSSSLPPVFSTSSLSISSCQAFPGGVLVLLRGAVRSLFLVLCLLLSRLLLFSVLLLGVQLLLWWFLRLLFLRLYFPPLLLQCFIWVLLCRLLPLLLLFFWFLPSLLQLGSRGCGSGRLASRCGLGGSCCSSGVCAV